MKHKLFLLLVTGFTMVTLQAQDNLGASGGGVTASAGSISYTLGQLVCNNASSSSGSVVHGVHQPAGLSVLAVLTETANNLEIVVYPNPTKEYLMIQVANNMHGELRYELYSVSGTLIGSGNITNEAMRVDLSELSPSVYYLSIITEEKEIKSFKIIKTE